MHRCVVVAIGFPCGPSIQHPWDRTRTSKMSPTKMEEAVREIGMRVTEKGAAATRGGWAGVSLRELQVNGQWTVGSHCLRALHILLEARRQICHCMLNMWNGNTSLICNDPAREKRFRRFDSRKVKTSGTELWFLAVRVQRWSKCKQ